MKPTNELQKEVKNQEPKENAYDRKNMDSGSKRFDPNEKDFDKTKAPVTDVPKADKTNTERKV